MIIWKKTIPHYNVQVHGADILSADDGALFATIWKDHEFLHHSKWTDEEKDLAFTALCEAQDPDNQKAWAKSHTIYI
jgi:hypothetical protein